MGMPTGIVKVFHRSRGYGFIRPEMGGEDIFVHRRALEASGIKHLRKGQRVSFDQANDLGRPFATNLHLVNKADPKKADSKKADPKEVNGVSHGFQGAQRIDVAGEKPGKKPDKPIRKPIIRAALEQALADAVRVVAPECEAFVGVIIERVIPETPAGANWAVKGVRYGRADRDRCEAALGMSLHEKQLEYTLSDEQK
jgi:CspA family cold shock protein